MRTYDEYMDNIRRKAKKLKARRRMVAAGCLSVFIVATALFLFLPYHNQLPDVSGYKNDPYYGLIHGLNKLTYNPPAHKNNYEWLKDAFHSAGKKGNAPDSELWFDGAVAGDAMGTTSVTLPSLAPGAQQYEEVTDNQVEGVIEGDLFKRSDKFIYYLRGNVLNVYSIDKENSALIGNFIVEYDTDVFYTKQQVQTQDKTLAVPEVWGYNRNAQMYLSADCSTVTVVSGGYYSKVGGYLVLTSLDVTDPENICQTQQLYFKGDYISSRMVGGDILLTYNYGVWGNEIDFDKPETFVPIYGKAGEMKLIEPENIYCPENPINTKYTVVAKLDGKMLEVKDTAAMLSYSQQLYVSEDTVYATFGYTDALENEDGSTTTKAMTQITGFNYTADELKLLGSVRLEGTVNNQYSMDEHEGILRVATSTVVRTRRETRTDNTVSVENVNTGRNCNLYCVDLQTWQVAGSVIGFAPDGEEVTSARFDEDKGYICTAEVIILSDPVYFFDLSNVKNITYKQTPIIDGFSSSLVNFGDYLLGIGFNENRELKLEAYVETEKGVEPIASHEKTCWFSEDYKAYFIDREKQLIGLAVGDWNGESKYMLLHFDGSGFRELKEIKIDYYLDQVRADCIEGWLYVLAEDLIVQQVW